MNIRDSETRSLIYVIIITLGMQFLSLARNSITASLFGASIEMDAYYISFNIATFMFSFFGSAVTTVLIPNIASKKEFSKGVNSFITCLFFLSIFVSVFAFIFKDQLISTIAGNKSEEFIKLASSLLSILLIGNVFTLLLGINAAIFQVRKRIMMLKVTQLISYGYIVFLLIWIVADTRSIFHYAFVIVTANIINLIIQLYYLKNENIIFKFITFLKNKEFIQMFKNLFPVFLSTGLYQISLLINTGLASRLGDGKVSILSYANQIIIIVNSLILANVILFIYPKLSILIKESLEKAKGKLIDYVLLVFFIMTFIVLSFILAGKEGVAILFERGAFSKELTSTVYSIAFIYIVALPLNALRDLFYKFFYADNDTYTPFKNSINVSALNIILSLILSYPFGLYGIVLGTSISTVLSFLMILIRFQHRYGPIRNNTVIKEILKIIAVFFLVLVIVNPLTYFFNGINGAMFIFITCLISLILFILFLGIMKSKLFRVTL